MRILVTMMGRSTWGLFNSVWASIRTYDFLPDRVHILTAGCDRHSADKAAGMLKVLLTESGSKGEVLVRVVPEEDVGGIAEQVKAITSEERRGGHSIALDVTPGKKAAVLGSVLSGMSRNDFDRIFYLYIEDLRNADRPFMEIPLSVQRPHDILAEVRDRRERGEGA
ncbi:MAG: hypothetical protein MUE65_05650 [Methanomassiliicoccales archaeon]|nr:hypothetical protein [Methanomassiliicoccales archaeon]